VLADLLTTHLLPNYQPIIVPGRFAVLLGISVGLLPTLTFVMG